MCLNVNSGQLWLFNGLGIHGNCIIFQGLLMFGLAVLFCAGDLSLRTEVYKFIEAGDNLDMYVHPFHDFEVCNVAVWQHDRQFQF